MRNSLIFSGGFHSLVFSLCSHFLPGCVVFLLSFPFTFLSPISLSAYCSQTTWFRIVFSLPYSDALWGSFCCPCLLFISLPLSLQVPTSRSHLLPAPANTHAPHISPRLGALPDDLMQLPRLPSVFHSFSSKGNI